MTIDVIFLGYLSNLFVKKRSKRFFNSHRYIRRNNVFVDTQKENTYHIKNNAIHISVSSKEVANIRDICECLNCIFKGNMVGIKADDLMYKAIKDESNFSILRM